MVSLPTSSNSSGNYGYRSNDESGIPRWQFVDKDQVLWDWAIKAQIKLEESRTELEELRTQHAEVKGLADYMTDSDVNQQIELKCVAAKNEALKRSLKWHQAMTAMASIVMVFVAPILLWLFK